MKIFEKRFPFADAPETMCFTCCHVLNDNEPIAYVSHDLDGFWQFLCGKNHIEDEARIVSLAEMLLINKGVAKFADLRLGEYAEKRGCTWIVGRK